jgi:hypothetical protein
MPEYSFLDNSMAPTSRVTHIKYVTTNVVGKKKVYEGSPIRSFPSDGVRFFSTTDFNQGTAMVFLTKHVMGLPIQTELVTHIARYTPGGGFKAADGGIECLTPQHILHLQTILPLPTASLVRFGPMDTPFCKEHVVAWVLLMLVIKSVRTPPAAQAMVIDLCVTLFKFRRVYLNSQIAIGIGMVAVHPVLVFCPHMARSLLWLVLYHCWPTPCMIMSGLCLADRAVIIAGLYAHNVGKLVYVIGIAVLYLLHESHHKLFMACITAGSVYVLLRLLDLDPVQLALPLWEQAMAALRQGAQ